MFCFLQDVQPNSPADLAGLKTNTDYIIGADSVLHEVTTFVSNTENRSLRFLFPVEESTFRYMWILIVKFIFGVMLALELMTLTKGRKKKQVR